jgi:galactose mutarotase-like enzyme
MFTLQSDLLKVQINPKGAELFSLFSAKTQREYLWQGDPKWWGGRAPVLFPVLCSMKDNTYTLKEKPYQMPKHGFVRHEVFSLAPTGNTTNTCTLEYTDNEKTRAMYPFAFIFQVIFSVTGNTLATTYRVVNRGDEMMYFSAGSHEAYNCLWEEDETFEDYYLEFDKDGDYRSEIITPEGLIDGATYPVIQNGRILPLKHELFDNDALVFRNVPASRVYLKSKKSAAVVEVDYQNAPHLGIWQKPGAPYICIEPWFGLPDEVTHNGKIEEKYGIVPLEKGKEFNWTHTITIHE